MLFNKDKFKKVNDKRILHKIKKHWVVISLALLGLFSNGVLVSHINASANTNIDTNNQHNNINNQMASKVSRSTKATLTHPVQMPLNNQSQSKSTSNNDIKNRSFNKATINNISAKANLLHKNILRHAALNNTTSNSPKIKRSVGNDNFLPYKYRKLRQWMKDHLPTPSHSIYIRPLSNYNFMENDPHFLASYYQWQYSKLPYYGLNFRFLPSTDTLEFTSGTLTWNGRPSDSSAYNNIQPFIGNESDTINDESDASDPTIYNNTHMQFTPGSSLMIDNPGYANHIIFDSDVNLNNVTNMSYMFYADPYLESVTFPSNSTSNVTSTRGMFSGDPSLREINNFDTSNVTDMSKMFESDIISNYDYNSNSFTIPNLNTSNVTNMSDMFADNGTLKSLILPSNFNTNNVTNMSYMFSGDNNLRSLILPSSFNTNKVSNMTNIFAYDPKIQSLTIQSPNTKIRPQVYVDLNSDSMDDGSPDYPYENNKVPSQSDIDKCKLPKMYKKIGNSISSVPNDFSKGNVGTFVTNASVPVPSDIPSGGSSFPSSSSSVTPSSSSSAAPSSGSSIMPPSSSSTEPSSNSSIVPPSSSSATPSSNSSVTPPSSSSAAPSSGSSITPPSSSSAAPSSSSSVAPSSNSSIIPPNSSSSTPSDGSTTNNNYSTNQNLSAASNSTSPTLSNNYNDKNRNNNSNNMTQLPKTGDNNNNKEIALVYMLLSADLGMLSLDLDKHRKKN